MTTKPEETKKPCKRCDGQGYIMIRNGEDYGDCPRCEGSGKEK